MNHHQWTNEPNEPRPAGTSRRSFLIGCGATVLGSAVGVGEGSGGGPYDATVRDLLLQGGFDPAAGNSVLLAVIADAHIFLGNEYPSYRTETYDDGLIDEINSLSALVSELVMAGDLISYHSMSPGMPQYPVHFAIANEEYDHAKVQMARYNYRTWIVPGNHDTTAYETNADLFREKMRVPPYQKAVFAGVPVFFLNSGSAGMLDPVQHEWFKAEAALVPQDQEVLIVVHYPPFFLRWSQAGVKRILTEVFRNHAATVWVMSGHNHGFDEAKFVFREVTFMQVQVTAATSLIGSFGDKRNPGYTLLGLQDGRLKCRIFRSRKDPGFQLRPPIAQMAARAVNFLFDELQYPLATYEEGFYDRTKRITEYVGVDVGCYIIYCKKIIFLVDPAAYMGVLNEFCMAGSVVAPLLPACELSHSGEPGSWEAVPFPTAKGGGLYRVAIPQAFRSGGAFYVKLDTGLADIYDGFIVSGWALASSGEELTGYERWILKTYETLEKSAKTHPHAITPGSTESNLVNFSFNLMNQAAAGIAGSPKLQRLEVAEGIFETTLVFARMEISSSPGVSYQLERSSDMHEWQLMPPADYQETIVRTDGAWSEVEWRILPVLATQEFYRVRLVCAAGW